MECAGFRSITVIGLESDVHPLKACQFIISQKRLISKTQSMARVALLHHHLQNKDAGKNISGEGDCF